MWIEVKDMKVDVKEIAFGGLFGAAALLLPIIFHVLHLGHIFMPMYLPLIALAFFVRPLVATTTSFLVPLLSGITTGIPPFYPPVALFMSCELAIMSTIISLVYIKWQNINEWLILIPVLLLGRVLYVIFVYLFSLVVSLPAGFMAGVTLLSGWPGLILIVVVVPPLVRGTRPRVHTDKQGIHE